MPPGLAVERKNMQVHCRGRMNEEAEVSGGKALPARPIRTAAISRVDCKGEAQVGGPGPRKQNIGDQSSSRVQSTRLTMPFKLVALAQGEKKKRHERKEEEVAHLSMGKRPPWRPDKGG